MAFISRNAMKIGKFSHCAAGQGKRSGWEKKMFFTHNEGQREVRVSRQILESLCSAKSREEAEGEGGNIIDSLFVYSITFAAQPAELDR